MSRFRAIVSGFLIVCLCATVCAQQADVSSLIESTPAVGGADTEETTAPAVTIKGFIPDLERDQMVKEAIRDVQIEDAKAAAQKGKGAGTPAAKKATGADSSDAAESEEETKRKAQELADRANGIVRPASMPGSGTELAPLKDTPVPTESATTPEPSTSLDTAPSLPPVPSAPALTLPPVPSGPEKSLPPVPAAPEIAQTPVPEKKKSVLERASKGDNIDVSGRIISVNVISGGSLRVRLRVGSDEWADAIVRPQMGMRKPAVGQDAKVSGRVIDTDERVVVQANSFSTSNAEYKGLDQSGGDDERPRSRSSARRSVPPYPAPGPMYGGPPIRPPVPGRPVWF